MRALIPKSPPGKEMFRRSLGTEMTLYGRNGGGTLAKTLEFVKTTSSLVGIAQSPVDRARSRNSWKPEETSHDVPPGAVAPPRGA